MFDYYSYNYNDLFTMFVFVSHVDRLKFYQSFSHNTTDFVSFLFVMYGSHDPDFIN